MKKKGIFYILFAFLIMFGLKANVFASSIGPCYYENTSYKGHIWLFYRDAKEEWMGLKVQSGVDEFYDADSTDKANGKVKFSSTDKCPEKIYHGNVWGANWSTTAGNRDKRYDLIQVNKRVCTYTKENSKIMWQLIQDPKDYFSMIQSGQSIKDLKSSTFFSLKQIRDENGNVVDKLAESKGDKLHFSILKGSGVTVNGQLNGDPCPSSIYYINNYINIYDGYWTQSDANYDSSRDNKYILNSRENDGKSIEEETSNTTARYCIYSFQNSKTEYLLRQEADYSVKLYELTDSEMVEKDFSLLDDGGKVKNHTISYCPNKLYMSVEGEFSNKNIFGGKLANSMSRVDSATCGFSYNGYKIGTPYLLFIKTANSYYEYSYSGQKKFENSNYTYDKALKNYSSFNIADNKTICGKLNNSETIEQNWTTFSIQKKVSDETVCTYSTSSGKFKITGNFSDKSLEVDVSDVSKCSDNNANNKVSVSGIKYSDVVDESNDCNFNTKFLLENIPGTKICRLIISSNGVSADEDNYIDNKQDDESNYSAIVTGDGGTNYKDTTYVTYKPICGIFKSEEAGGKLFPIIKNIYKIFKIAIPILIAILTIVEFLKVLFSGEDKTMKDAFKATTTRFILLVVVILLPIFIEFIIKLSGMSENCLQYFVK